MKAILFMICAMAISCCPCYRIQEVASRPERLPKSWLKEQTTIEKEESGRLKQISTKPYSKWEEFKRHIQLGDQIWYWETPDYHGDRQDVGYCMVRGQKFLLVVHINTLVEVD